MLTSANQTPVSLADVFPSCLAAVGLDGAENRLGLNAAHSAVVILIDGLGQLNLSTHKAHARFLSQATRGAHLRTVFPSTTASALASLTTGTWPGAHGLVGYKVRDPETGWLLNQLRDLGSLSPDKPWALADPLYSEATARGITTTVISHPRLTNTPLSNVIHAGATMVGESTIESRLARCAELLATTSSSLTLVYVSELDEAAHKFGVNSREWTTLLENLDHALSQFVKRLPRHVGVILTADHGVIDVPAHKQLLYGTSDDQMSGISEVGGEPRCLQLYLEPHAKVEAIVERWSEDYGPVAEVLTRDDVIERGLMGAVSDRVRGRLGDVFVMATKMVAFYDARDETMTGRAMIGQHGALSDEELRIPLLLWGSFAE